MSNAAHLLSPRLRAAALVILAAHDPRFAEAARVAPEIVLDTLHPRLFADVVEEATAVLAAIDAVAASPAPRKAGPLAAADAEALRLDLGAGTLLILARDHRGTARAALAAAAADTAVLGHAEAHELWRAVAAVLRTSPDDPPPTAPDHPETSP